MELIKLLKKDKNKVLVLLDQIIVSGGNFVLGLVLIRTLGLADYGLYALLWMGVLFALNLHQAFITKPMMTLAIGKTEGTQQHYFNQLWWIQLTVGGILLLLLIAVTQIGQLLNFTAPWLVYLPIMVVLAIVYLLQDFVKKTFFIQKSYWQPLFMDSLIYGFLFLGLGGLYCWGMDQLLPSLFVLLGSYCIGLGAFSKKLFKQYNRSAIDNWQTTLKTHYHFSSWLLGTSILQWFSGNFFLITAASTIGTTAVGAVRIGQNIVGLCHVFFLAMENIVPVEAAQLFLQKGVHGLRDYLIKCTKKLSVILFIVLSSIALAATSLIQTLYGVSFISYTYVVWGYCWLYFFVFYGYPARYYFRTLRSTKPIFIAYCASAVFSLITAVPMVTTWGIVGVLAGLISSQIITLLIYSYYIIGSTHSITQFSEL